MSIQPDTRPRRRRRRRWPRSPLLLIVVVGVAAIAIVFALASALDDDRPHGPYLIGAWTFGDDVSLQRAVKAGAIDEVSVDWLQSRADGSLEAPKYDGDFLDAVRDQDCRVFVTLTDYDESTHSFEHAISKAILATAAARRSHAAAVARWCAEHGVDGVDVDWEALHAAQRDAFSAFVEELAVRLHRDGRLIAVDVYPKTNEPGGWAGPQAQDWERLGRAVDEFRIMTYNFSGSWSGAGPLSPPDWMDRILDFAETQVPPRRVVMGLGFYGRDWCSYGTRDLLWSDVGELRTIEGVSERRSRSAELRLDYRLDGRRHTAYFPDAAAIAAKLRMMTTEHPHIRGVFAWIMGQEDPGVWRLLRRQLHTSKAAGG